MKLDFFRRGSGAGAALPIPERKASAAGPAIAYQTSGRVAWTPRDTASLIAEAAAALPLILQDKQRRFDEHPVLCLLARPNPMQGRAELFEAIYAQLLLSGNAYIEAVGGEAGTPVELYVLRSDRMSLVPGPDGWPIAYDYTVGAKTHRFTLATGLTPICHIKSFHPQDDHYGLSPMQAAASAVDVHNSASRWSKALLDNAARPSGAIVYRGGESGFGLSDEQISRLKDEMESYHQGAANAGRPMLLDGGLDWKPMGFSPSDMEFQKTKESAAREIALAFGVPPMLLGIPGDATYANYQEANRAFYRLTVLPLVSRIASGIGHWLAEQTGDDFTLAPDLDQVPALSVERDAQWARVAAANFLSDSEKRSLLGLPKIAEEE
jgi:HK97 family phage portal protein